MKTRFGITQTRPLADFLPTLTIAAKNLATEMTNHRVLHEDLWGELPITSEHVLNNKSVRQMLGQRGIKPEDLPLEEYNQFTDHICHFGCRPSTLVSGSTFDAKPCYSTGL